MKMFRGAFLQESDVFADALTAARPVKDVKKKKRRLSATQETKNKETSPPKKSEDVKPVFKFYQDTLITTEDKSEPVEDEGGVDQLSKAEIEDEVARAEEAIDEVLKQEDKKNVEREKNRLPKGVLVYVRNRKTAKKSVQWRTEPELESIKYFELDETERVNVTKTFTDMKQMERINERMALRKMVTEDKMEEKIPWRTPEPMYIPGEIVIPGKNSLERDIQQVRERTTLQAIYFNKSMIPDSPGEPDLEIHAATEPTIIPLEDQTGNPDAVISYRDKPWPEPKGFEAGCVPGEAEGQGPPMMPPNMMHPEMPQPEGMMPPHAFPPYQMPNPYQMNMMGPGPEWMPPNAEGNMMMPGPMNGPPGMPPVMHPGMMGPPEMYGPSHDYMVPGGPMGPVPPPQFMGPPHPGMFHGQFPGPQNGPPMVPAPMGDGGRPPRPWFRQNNGSSGPGGGSWRHPSKGGGGGSWGKNRGICNNFTKKGFCRVNKCPYRHPNNKSSVR